MDRSLPGYHLPSLVPRGNHPDGCRTLQWIVLSGPRSPKRCLGFRLQPTADSSVSGGSFLPPHISRTAAVVAPDASFHRTGSDDHPVRRHRLHTAHPALSALVSIPCPRIPNIRMGMVPGPDCISPFLGIPGQKYDRCRPRHPDGIPRLACRMEGGKTKLPGFQSKRDLFVQQTTDVPGLFSNSPDRSGVDR